MKSLLMANAALGTGAIALGVNGRWDGFWVVLACQTVTCGLSLVAVTFGLYETAEGREGGAEWTPRS